MESIASKSKIRKEEIREKVQILDDIKTEIFRQKNSMMQNQFLDQKNLSIALNQVDKKIHERLRKNDEVLKALMAVRNSPNVYD